MTLSYTDIVTGHHERFATVLDASRLLKYEPSGIDNPPLLYTVLVSFEDAPQGQIAARRYRLMHRLVLLWQDNQQAEIELMPYVDSIPATINGSTLGRRLNDRLTAGLAIISEARAGYIQVSGVWYRSLDFFSTVVSK